MYNPYYGLPAHQQVDKRYSYEQAQPKHQIFETNEFLYQNLISTINLQRKMMEEIDSIKLQLLQVKEQNRSYLERIHAMETQKQELDPEEKKQKKLFRKNIYCPYQTCGNKYSSKIALNSHMKNKHKKIHSTAVSKTTDSQAQ